MIRLFIIVLFTNLFFANTLLAKDIIPAADRPALYLPLLKGKNVALVVNHSSRVGRRHLVDFLLANNIKVKKIFAPEHGFRGSADAGSSIKNSRDKKTKLPIISLYGKHKKPTKRDLKDIDIVLFDIQDVGVRFYTYLSTLHYVMEAVAKLHIPMIVLDRPNPNAHYIDGPMLERGYRSFVGLDPVPIVYGMTIGEYAMMLNGEGWLNGGVKAKLKVIPIANYTHQSHYRLPIKPSPNLPNSRAIALYPSLALFEGTLFSAGRGTKKQFQLYCNPHYQIKKTFFVPRPRAGARHPKHNSKRCYGRDLSGLSLSYLYSQKRIDLSYILDAYRNYPDKRGFFLKNHFFDKLSGSSRLREQIEAGVSKSKIRESWSRGLSRFKVIRSRYLIYN
ncbi:alternate gene name: yzbB [hydrothermal vent metagenome]|uniref:Alternate gene name: yzbB n=1 Tax=hydrothermal vent metagenome TaxID=652676 RepID=A0A1W1BS05_9ZZZZ